jgi:hypothetical protein
MRLPADSKTTSPGTKSSDRSSVRDHLGEHVLYDLPAAVIFPLHYCVVFLNKAENALPSTIVKMMIASTQSRTNAE